MDESREYKPLKVVVDHSGRIYATAYKQNPKLFEFLRSMDAYKNAMTAGKDTLVLDPNSEFFKYFNDINGALK